MPREIRRARGWYDVGDKEPINAGDLDTVTLKADTEVTVWSKQVAQDKRLFHGHGSHVRDIAEAFIGMDLLASGNGAGADGDEINGKMVLAITDSDQRRVLASTTIDSLSQLRDALAETRTDRIVEEAMGPYAKPGRHLELRIEATSGSDGVELDPVDSTGVMYYTEVGA